MIILVVKAEINGTYANQPDIIFLNLENPGPPKRVPLRPVTY